MKPGLTAVLREWLRDGAATGSGSFVMATGVISWSMGLSGHVAIEDTLLALCAAGWLVLATVFVYRLVAHSRTWWLDTAEFGAWTAVAGTTVFANALDDVLGWQLAMLVLWIVAASLWAAVTLRVVLRLPPKGSTGLAFLLTVATQGVSLLAASLAVAYGEAAFVHVAFVLWMLGIALYLVVVLHAFDYRRVTTGSGDHWIFGGALAITVLAGAKLLLAVQTLGVLGGIEPDLEIAVTVAWVIAMPILGLLVWSELAFPRLGYSSLRWATVFPVGMYATCTLVASAALGHPWMDRDFAEWWVWVGLGVWIVVGIGLLRRAVWMVSGRVKRVSSDSL